MADCDEPENLRDQAKALSVDGAAAATDGPAPETSDPMLDVHLRHGAAHTWKDFWIHLGTISVGLLIAIGLEQSVEAVHRLHQRHQLEDDLRKEASHNLALLAKNDQYIGPTRLWLMQLRGKVEERRRSSGGGAFDYVPAPNKGVVEWPEATSWNVAKASGQVALLPRDEARMYDFVYSEQTVVQERVYAYAAAMDALRRFESRFASLRSDALPASAGTEQDMRDYSYGSIYHDTPIPDVTTMAAEELREYSALLNDALTELGRLHVYTNAVYQFTRALTLGAKSEDEVRHLVPSAQMSDQLAAAGGN